MLQIALIGHDTRNDNLGVGALTVSEIDLLRNIARRQGLEVRIVVLAKKGKRTTCVYGEDVVERAVRPLRKPWDFLSSIRNCDLAIDISGGDSFSDIYGNRRIFQILLQKFLVHLGGCPLVMAPQTVGPFKKRIWRTLALWSIRRCAVVATRDDQSAKYLYDRGVRGSVVEASDVALRLPFSPPRREDEIVKVGLNVSGLLMNGGYSGDNMFGLKEDYPTLIRALIRQFEDCRNCQEIHLVGHVIPEERGNVEDDYQACLDLQKEFPKAIVAPAFQTPSEAKDYIAGLDFFVGARMHSCIAAFSSLVPVVPMSYSRKFQGLFGSLGYNEIVDCRTENAEEIFGKIRHAFEMRAELKGEVERALKKGNDSLDRYEAALEELLVRLSR